MWRKTTKIQLTNNITNEKYKQEKRILLKQIKFEKDIKGNRPYVFILQINTVYIHSAARTEEMGTGQ